MISPKKKNMILNSVAVRSLYVLLIYPDIIAYPVLIQSHGAASGARSCRVLPVTESTTEEVLVDRLQSFLALIIPWGKNMAGRCWKVLLGVPPSVGI